MDYKSFGIRNQVVLNNDTEKHLEELTINGFTIVEDVLSNDELTIAREKLDHVYNMQTKEIAEENLGKINEQLLARLPLAYDDYFIDFLKIERINSILEMVFGNYFILHLQNGIINMPKQAHHQNSWHRDLPYQDFIISKPIAISVLYCIDDFNEATGGTLVIPYSHKLDKMPSITFIENHAKQTIAKAGSVILFDSMIFHRAGYNSSDNIRRGINHIYTSAILKQQINIPESLKGKFSNDPFLKMLLGYETITPASVLDWRNKKLNK
jgi:ectoine hydroxylase-related dioxygenase (phytanoyl-CoA dioxygenase family)